MNFNYLVKNELWVGKDRLLELNSFLIQKKINRLGIIVDGNLYDNNLYVKQWIDTIQETNVCIIEFYREKFEPTYEYLDSLYPRFQSKDKEALVDITIGIGGGSTMDTAKGLAIMLKNEGPAIQYRGFPKDEDIAPPLPIITIPSTAGTGSEGVYNAVFLSEAENVKMGINTALAFPLLSILDSNVAMGAPKSVILSSGIDALSHALEAFAGKHENVVSKTLAEKAITMILKNISIFYHNPLDLDSCNNMLLASYFACQAMNNSTGGPAGAFSYLLGPKYKIPHGLASGVFVRFIVDMNQKLGYTGYDIIENNLSEHLKNLYIDIDVPLTLRDLEIPKTEKPAFIEHFHKVSKAFDMNPKEISEDFFSIYLDNIL